MTPAVSVWCLESISNGDICIGGDGSVRLFSTFSPFRQASPQEINVFNEKTKNFAVNESQQ